MRIQDSSGAWISLDNPRSKPEGWIEVDLQVGSTWFKGGFLASFNRKELESAVAHLGELNGNLAGAYEFDAYDGQINAVFAMGKRGDLSISVRLQNHPDLMHELRILLMVDQSYLPQIIQELTEIANL